MGSSVRKLSNHADQILYCWRYVKGEPEALDDPGKQMSALLRHPPLMTKASSGYLNEPPPMTGLRQGVERLSDTLPCSRLRLLTFGSVSGQRSESRTRQSLYLCTVRTAGTIQNLRIGRCRSPNLHYTWGIVLRNTYESSEIGWALRLPGPLDGAFDQELVTAVQAFMDDAVPCSAHQHGVVGVADPAPCGLAPPFPLAAWLG